MKQICLENILYMIHNRDNFPDIVLSVTCLGRLKYILCDLCARPSPCKDFMVWEPTVSALGIKLCGFLLW